MTSLPPDAPEQGSGQTLPCVLARSPESRYLEGDAEQAGPLPAGEEKKPVILALIAWYLPGFKSGGPVRSLSNLVECLGEEFRFRIATRDRDVDDPEPYPETASGEWHPVGNGEVRYLAAPSAAAWMKLLRETEHDVLYLNSFFNPRFTILPLLLRRLGLVPQVPVVVAPRGEFALGSLSLKAPKKRLFLRLAMALGLYRDVVWQATGPAEAEDIRRVFGEGIRLMVARCPIAHTRTPSTVGGREDKAAGRARITFLSRICRAKNLEFAVEVLQGVQAEVEFDIYGPVEDPVYWAECQRRIAQLPPNVRVRQHGAVPHDRVGEVLSGSHLFFLPTRGENFGHVILEALRAGCPVLISDRTPWRNLAEKGVGWDLPLERPELFREVIEAVAGMDAETLAGWTERARAFGLEQCRNESAVAASRALFQTALEGSPKTAPRP